MLDWKKRTGKADAPTDTAAGASANTSGDASAKASANSRRANRAGQPRGRHWKALLLSRAVLGVVGLYLLATIGLGIYWSREPALFQVQQNAQAHAQRDGRQMVVGYTTVETLKTISQTLLDKPGGYLSNDRFPPGLWLDNMPSWEYGVLVQVRDMSRALRKDFSRSQSQSTEDGDLAQAEPRFNFDNRSWMFPSSESEFQRGIDLLDNYEKRLSSPEQKSAFFYTRADNLNNWLGDVSTRLGSMSQRLSASVGRVKLNAASKTDTVVAGQAAPVEEEYEETPWLKIDNVFYESRGQAWALSLLLRAVEVDFADVLAKKNATVSVRQIIRELEAAQEPLWSPMVLNGSGYGIFANHSLVMANYLSRANAAVLDLRQLLSQG